MPSRCEKLGGRNGSHDADDADAAHDPDAADAHDVGAADAWQRRAMSTKPSAQGTLAKTPFAHLLMFAHERRLTGTLAIWPEQNASGGRGQDRLFLQDGTVVAARCIAAAASAFDAVVQLFARSDGPYGFYADQNLLGSGDDILRGTVDVYTVMARGVLAHAREAAVEGLLARIAGRPIRVRNGLPLERLQLSAAQQALVERLQKQQACLTDLLRDAPLPTNELRRILYLLMLIRGVETAEGQAAPTGLTVETMPPAPRAPSEPTPSRADPISRSHSIPAPVSSIRPPAVSFASSPAPNTGLTLLPAPPAPAGLSPQDALRWSELAAAYDRLDDINHYQLLNISQNVSAADINTAYFALVKKFHPDRLPTTLAPLLRCAQQLFERLTEANDTLSNPEDRLQYDRAVADGGGTRAAERMMRNVLDSTLEYQKAEVLMKRRDFAQAMQHVRAALNKNPEEPDYHAMYGWLLHLMNPSEPAPLEEILASLDRAIKANPNSERTHYYRGVVLKRLKRDKEALQHFRVAVQINPRNVEAARELRLASMRRDSKPPPSGLLSKFFKGPKDN
jgi:curved DNA-binding protein CbpA